MTTLSAAVLLFLVMEPVWNTPVFLSLLAPLDPRRARRAIVRELLIALGVMILFLFAGRYLLQVLQVTEPATWCLARRRCSDAPAAAYFLAPPMPKQRISPVPAGRQSALPAADGS